jgi:predicted metal-binding transcription factor (methanogenesis marker protein 9)
VACQEYEALKKQLLKAMREEARAHREPVKSPMAHAIRLESTKRLVELAEDASRRHVHGCEQCQAEGNELRAGHR